MDFKNVNVSSLSKMKKTGLESSKVNIDSKKMGWLIVVFIFVLI